MGNISGIKPPDTDVADYEEQRDIYATAGWNVITSFGLGVVMGEEAVRSSENEQTME